VFHITCILTGDYVAALQILNEFVEFVEACVVAGARGNYNAILHRYYLIMKIIIYCILIIYTVNLF